MTTYSESGSARVGADKAFAYLSDVENLPQYFPRVTSARRTGGDTVEVTAHLDSPDAPEEVRGEAWFRVEPDEHRLTWGAEGPNNYSGQLDLAPEGDGACTVTVRIQTENADGDRVQEGLREAVANVARELEKGPA